MADSAPVEYEVIQGKARAIEKQLNELAAGGWQVIGVTSVGVFRMRHDVNFTGADYAYTGIALFFGALLWIYWVLEAFS